MRLRTCVVFGLLLAIAACSASGAIKERGDAGPPDEDASAPEAAPAEDAGQTVELDADRPLVCGDGGFCETRLPRSESGVPLSVRGVWVAAANDVWSVTKEGFVLHYDGAGWTIEHRTNHELHSVWATPTTVWVGGEAGLLFHRSTAKEWSRIETGHVRPIRSIYGTSDGDVWFTRNDAALDHFDGTKLTKRAVDIQGLRITTVFGRAEVGTYALGHVTGDVDDAGTALDQPHAFELAGGAIAPFNASLPDRRGFVPAAGFVTNSVDPERRIFMVGFERRHEQVSGPAERFRFAHCLFGGSSAIDIVTSSLPDLLNPTSDGEVPQQVLEMSFPGLNYKASDIRLPFKMWRVLRWNGQGFSSSSLAMGRDVPPAPILGAHAGETESWIVGEGFALKGANP